MSTYAPVQLGRLQPGGTRVQPGGCVLISGSITYAGTSVISAIQTWWAATQVSQGLTTLNKLWFKVAPENAQILPYATIFRVSEVPETQTTGYALMRTSVQINCHCQRAEDAESLGATIRSALKGAPLVVNSVPVDHVLPDGDTLDVGEGLGTSGRDCWVAIETFDIVWTRN